ncbi:MAG: hypothetical protein GF414_00720 [Candidatus Altiarchaeales archaeon]|nr:hypothetical protein [Candidatus Altiarchaeales archaeon]
MGSFTFITNGWSFDKVEIACHRDKGLSPDDIVAMAGTLFFNSHQEFQQEMERAISLAEVVYPDSPSFHHYTKALGWLAIGRFMMPAWDEAFTRGTNRRAQVVRQKCVDYLVVDMGLPQGAVAEYVVECETQDGYGYWDNYFGLGLLGDGIAYSDLVADYEAYHQHAD